MTLREYRRKRNFKKSTEPKGKKRKRKSKQLTYVMHKHAAKHLHYDLRLEVNGVLRSWAVPKGPSLNPTVKRLAVQVEDHPIEYGKFEGTIPEKEYGAGSVMIWDRGSWEMQENEKLKDKDSFTFVLHGKKLKGKWKLIRIRKDPKNWLLIKINDKFARNNGYDVTKELPLSVLSGKALFQISDKNSNLPSSRDKILKLLKKLQVKKRKIPSTIPFQLSTLVDEAPEGKKWLHEIKYDGYRLMCHINKEIKLLTRNHLNWSKKYPTIMADIAKLELKNTVLDGELIALNDNKSSFQQLQLAQKENKFNLIYYVFDILYYNNYLLSSLPLITRKKILQMLLDTSQSSIRYSDHVVSQGPDVFQKACQMSLEGVISKEINSVYAHKRTKTWLKVKCLHQQEFIVCGFTKPLKSRSYFGSLVLGYYTKNKQLKYAGCVGTGFDEAELKTIFNLLSKNSMAQSPFKEKINLRKKVTWVKPKLIVEVAFREWTKDGLLRQPSFKRLRADKESVEATLEKTVTIGTNLALSHPMKILYPKVGITKFQIAQYYNDISEQILPFIVNRPLTLLRCPNGINETCFYQRHLKHQEKTNSLFSIKIPGKNDEEYLYIKNKKGLLKLVQMGVLEIHPWPCKVDNPSKPDRIIFDLDPGVDVAWKDIVSASFILKEELENYHLKSYVTLTGKKGLHIVVPIQRRYGWEKTVNFAKTFVNYLSIKYANLFVKSITKSKRKGKIFIDYMRNHQGATAIAPFSTRATEKATLAVPLAWKDLSVKIKPDQVNVNNIKVQLTKINLLTTFDHVKQSLPLMKE